MVTGPGPRVRGALSSSAELLHLNGSRMCSLPNLPEYRNGHTQSGLLTCGGGRVKKTCITFTGGEWKKREREVLPRGLGLPTGTTIIPRPAVCQLIPQWRDVFVKLK